MGEMTLEQAVETLERGLNLKVDMNDTYDLRVMKAFMAGVDYLERQRIAALPAHNAKVDPLNEQCPFAVGQHVRLVKPLPGENEHGIQVGDEGIVNKGFAGIRCVCFNTAPRWGLMSEGDIWITDLCEAIGSESLTHRTDQE